MVVLLGAKPIIKILITAKISAGQVENIRPLLSVCNIFQHSHATTVKLALKYL